MKRRPRAVAGFAAVSMIAAAMSTSTLVAFQNTSGGSSGNANTYSRTPAPVQGGDGIGGLLPPTEQNDETLVMPPVVAGGGGPVGVNLSHIDYSMVEWVFVDAMKGASRWFPQLVSGGPWDTGAFLEQTSDGYPILAPGQAAATLMFAELKGHYPGGQYICLYDGQGTIEFGNDAHIVSQTPGRIVLNVTPTDGGIILRITSTPNPSNPIRNVRVLVPGTESTYQSQPFNQTYLQKLSKYSVIRFMDFQRTNNSPLVNWSDRPKPSDRTQATDRGVALEYMIKLCNTLGADAWFCMPHKANDQFIQQFATMVKEQLNPGLKVYIEHSNETWNGGFQQAGYCQQQGLAAGLSGDPYLAQVRWHSKRSVEIFNIWKNVFGTQSNTRLVRVLAGQHDNPWVGRQIMDYNNAYQNADAFAVAPYFGSNLGWPDSANQTASMSISQILDAAQQNIYTRRAMTVEAFGDAHARGLELIAYEGGQHLCGVGSAANNATLTDKFVQANRDPRMKNLYLEDLYGWVQSGGGVFCAYASAGHYGQWGSWGVMEWQDQPRSQAPKYDALMTFIENWEGTNPPPPSLAGDTVDSVNFQPPPDGFVNSADLAFMLAEWGNNPGSPADIVTTATLQPPPDGKVDSADLAVLLGNWSN